MATTQTDVEKTRIKSSLRFCEYYNMQDKFDELYDRSLKGLNFQHLYEIITSRENILLAYRTIKRNHGSYTAGTNGRTIKDWEKIPTDIFINYIRKRLENFEPLKVKRVLIPKPNGKKRPLGIPCIEDRLIQQCIKQVLEPICEAKFNHNSYGFRPNRKAENAINAVQSKINLAKCYYILNFDIKGFFNNVNHSKLIKQIWTLGIHDKKLISIIKAMLKAEIIGEGIPDKGIPQGGILSPLLANIVLNELDWWITSQWEDFKTNIKPQYNKNNVEIKSNKYRHLRNNSDLKEIYIIRYADDFKIICRNYDDAELTYKAVTMWLLDRLKLEISQEKSGIVDVRKNNIEFLGFKMRTRKHKKKDVVKTNMTDKAIKNATSTLRKAIKNLRKEPTVKNVFKYNSLVSGLQNYYQIASHVSKDFTRINYNLLNCMKNRIKPISTKSGIKTKDYVKRYEGKKRKSKKGKNRQLYYVRGIALYPINIISKRDPSGFNHNICDYTEKGRKLIHDKLNKIDTTMLVYIMENPIGDKSIEYNDNRISLYSAQIGKCAISGLPLDCSMETHHIKPVKDGGSDEYKNLMLITYEIHKLIHATSQDIIAKYLEVVNLDNGGLKKLNKYRLLVGNFEIER